MNNTVITIGRLAKDPIMGCNKIAKLELVSVNGECTQFTHCVAIGKQAELVMSDLKKDMLVYIKRELKSGTLEAFTFLKS